VKPDETRDDTVSPEAATEDLVGEVSLRPKTLAEYIGQPLVRENLDIAIRAARARREPLDHVLPGVEGREQPLDRQQLADTTLGQLGEEIEDVEDLEVARERPVTVPRAGAVGVGLIEAWRGPVVVGLEAGADGSILRCHPQDPSWHNWPALEHAIIGNIVPDFPLINKSFNLSYSGHDL
jgi:hypothetical protein